MRGKLQIKLHGAVIFTSTFTGGWLTLHDCLTGERVRKLRDEVYEEEKDGVWCTIKWTRFYVLQNRLDTLVLNRAKRNSDSHGRVEDSPMLSI